MADLALFLRGTWTVERVMLDRSSGARGSFSGTVVFEDADDGAALLQREHGTVRWGDHEGPASREYVWRPGDTPDAMDVFFPDGRFFHPVRLGGTDSEPAGWHAEHWCDPDDYRVTYAALGPDEFRYEWDVTGPAKDLLLTSRLRRALHGDPTPGWTLPLTRGHLPPGEGSALPQTPLL
ncbi:DUF6314 family protein [Sinomonas sp. G460-2]|uniref:DUF6314 family protein n=1 Tax=Sinomonas sp. G460-2 TaxID=3393464 RepID=UPI0039EE9A08